MASKAWIARSFDFVALCMRFCCFHRSICQICPPGMYLTHGPLHAGRCRTRQDRLPRPRYCFEQIPTRTGLHPPAFCGRPSRHKTRTINKWPMIVATCTVRFGTFSNCKAQTQCDELPLEQQQREDLAVLIARELFRETEEWVQCQHGPDRHLMTPEAHPLLSAAPPAFQKV